MNDRAVCVVTEGNGVVDVAKDMLEEFFVPHGLVSHDVAVPSFFFASLLKTGSFLWNETWSVNKNDGGDLW